MDNDTLLFCGLDFAFLAYTLHPMCILQNNMFSNSNMFSLFGRLVGIDRSTQHLLIITLRVHFLEDERPNDLVLFINHS